MKTKKLNKFCSLFDPLYFIYDFAKLTGAIPALLLFRIKKIYINKETKKQINKGPIMVASNHHTFFDPMILLTSFFNKRLSIVATDGLFDNKAKKTIFTLFRAIPVNKENPSIKTFKEVNNVVNRGHSVAMFPEGKVDVNNNDINDYKAGVILMAYQAKVDIYPVYIVKREKWYHRVKVIYGERFVINDYLNGEKLNKNNIDKVSSILKEKELELEKYYHNISKKES